MWVRGEGGRCVMGVRDGMLMILRYMYHYKFGCKLTNSHYLSSLSFSLFRVESASNSVRCSPTRCLHCSSRVALGGYEGEEVCMCGECA